MDTKTKKICDLLTLIVVCFTLVPLFFYNGFSLLLFVPSLLLFISLFFRSFMIADRFLKIDHYEIFLLLGEYVLVTIIVFTDGSHLSQILYYILIADGVLFYHPHFSISYTLLIIISHTISLYLKGYFVGLYQLLIGGMINSLSFVFVFLLFFMLRHQIEQRNKITRAREEIEKKNKKLEEAFASLEEMTILRERNRIAREVHDTMGHTLTTVYMGLEACQRLLDSDPKQAKERVVMVQGQIRKGLEELRNTIKAIHNQEEIIHMESAVEDLLAQTHKQTGLESTMRVCLHSSIPLEVKKILLRVLQEGITNAIKHGGCTEITVEIEENRDGISLILQDNGMGVDKVTYGFGLYFMRERIHELDGELSVQSKKGDGFQLLVQLPLEGETYGENTDTDSG